MRVAILTIGTRGDFELFLTLARALHRRGHAVIVGTSPFYCARVRDAGLAWFPVGAGTRDEMLRVLRSLATLRGDDRTAEFNARWVQPQIAGGIEHVTTTAAAADYFVSNVKMVLAREDGIIPGATVTYDPPGSFASFEKSRAPDRQGRTLDLVAMPKALVDPGGAWPAWVRFTGFWTSADADDARPSAGLAAFVESGPPPVVLTMGSMLMVDPARLGSIVAEALHRTGQRGVVVAGWSNPPAVASADVHVVAEAPYDWLFARASCVIHHGGTGTVAAVLRAGTPSILLPQLTAQERFARLLVAADVAAAVLDVETVDAEALATAIARAVSDARLHASVQRWRTLVRAEAGVDGAVDAIESHAAEVARR